MRWKRLISEILVLIAGFLSVSADEAADSLRIERYHKRLERRQEAWNRLIPTVFPLQYAGGMGMFSAGIGWDYGRDNKFETHRMIGFLPKRYNSSAYATLTLREEYLPWRIRIASTPFEVRPLSVSLAMNTIFSSDFWTSEPDRYPNGYYAFSSRVRFHLGIGSRLTFRIPERRRYVVKHISLYYVVSVCDLYLRQKIVDSAVPTGDIFTIGIGAILTI